MLMINAINQSMKYLLIINQQSGSLDTRQTCQFLPYTAISIAKYGNFFLLNMARIARFGKFENKINLSQACVLSRML